MYNNAIKISLELQQDQIRKLCGSQLGKWQYYLYKAVYIPSLMVSMILFNNFDLKVGVFLAVFIQSIGNMLNLLVSIKFYFLIIGQTLCAIAYPMLLSSIA